jgi:hypothetical protein
MKDMIEIIETLIAEYEMLKDYKEANAALLSVHESFIEQLSEKDEEIARLNKKIEILNTLSKIKYRCVKDQEEECPLVIKFEAEIEELKDEMARKVGEDCLMWKGKEL